MALNDLPPEILAGVVLAGEYHSITIRISLLITFRDMMASHAETGSTDIDIYNYSIEALILERRRIQQAIDVNTLVLRRH